MKNMKRILLTVVAAMLLVAVSVGGTLAYLQASTNPVINTFTQGKVHFGDEEDLNDGLDEALTNEYGEPLDKDGNVITDEDWKPTDVRVTGNTYKLLAGHKYVKDPTVTLGIESEPAYVRMFLSIDHMDTLETLFENDTFVLDQFIQGRDTDIWELKAEKRDGNTITYEFWYIKGDDVVDAREAAKTLEPLFTHFTLPGTATNDDIEILKDMKIIINADAIQASDFDDQTAAWTAWQKIWTAPAN